MTAEIFETKYLPGLPPSEGGCPPLQHRVDHADGMFDRIRRRGVDA